MYPVATPTDGVGQPPTPSRRMRLPGCNNNHSDPQRAGDCRCADEANEREEQEAEAAMDAAGPCGGTSAECFDTANLAGDKGASYACSTHAIYVRAHRVPGRGAVRS